MNTKLTLTIESSIIEKAKIYAKSKENSLSGIVENYLKIVTNDQQNPEIELTPAVKAMKGKFKAPDSFDYKKELANRLNQKYLQYE
jgi:hypothetical protein